MVNLRRIVLFLGLAAALAPAVAARAQSPDLGASVRSWFNPQPAPDAGFDDGDVQPAALFQPAAEGQPQPERRPAVVRRTPASQQANIRLASVPNMFGDLGSITAVAAGQVIDMNGMAQFVKSNFGIPTAGSIRTGKISENDTPIPVDRVFFSYNHFNDLFQVTQDPIMGVPGVSRQEPLDRYTIGAEKTFLDGLYSVELRMPFNGTYDQNLQSFGINGGNIGNLAVVLKSLVYSDSNLAVGAGMAIDTPTGSETNVRLGQSNLRFRNESVHLLPYVGFIYSPGDPQLGWGNGLFLTGFGQIDVTANGNAVEAGPLNGKPTNTLGTFTDQNLLFLDIAAGYWVYRNPYAERWTGLATVAEFHYTTSLQDADTLSGSTPTGFINLRSPQARLDIVNATFGVQALMFDASSLRVAYAIPLGDQRVFSNEVQVQFNRRF